MRNFNFFVILFVFCLTSCQINQYENSQNSRKRTGKWIEKDSTENGLFLSKGSYKHGEKIGVWKTYLNNKRYQKERIKDTITDVKIFSDNGKIAIRGKTKLIITDKERHWFYEGKWKYYDKNGKLYLIRNYLNGQKIDSLLNEEIK